MKRTAISWTCILVTSLGLELDARAQSFINAPSHIPPNGGFTENVDFADVDLDGDHDVLLAEGGDAGNERNRLWINGASGPIGFFADETNTRVPALLDDSRDVDFVDIDGDGDSDVYVSNTSAVSQQSNRWWINMGGAQGGAAGYFVDQTAARFVDIAVNDGVTKFSSISIGSQLFAGGFIDWSCDCVFGDLDSDGDMDLFHSTYGGVFGGSVPSRVFLNDGAGFFREFNPSHVQLPTSQIGNGIPALWCEGVHQHGTQNVTGAQADIADTPLGVELGDLDGDFDLDVLHGARNETPRLYRNRTSETGALAFRDVTFASFAQFATGGGNYEQELGDFDNDDDLDLYGLNWPSLDDCTARNDGAGSFGAFFTLPGSSSDDNEGDWFDYDNDGQLDIFVANFSGQDRLYENLGGPSWQHADVTGAELPNDGDISLGGDSSDVDEDGDYDFLIANDAGQAERLLLNTNQIADTYAPRPVRLEQAPNRAAGAAPTIVRVHVYGNSSWDVARYDDVGIEFSFDGGAQWYPSAARYGGGEMFRGEIRGDIAGTILYRARAEDEHGNIGLSTVKSYVASGCTGNVVEYCTGKMNSSFCVPSMDFSGIPSLSGPDDFHLLGRDVLNNKQGLLFWGAAAINVPFQGGRKCVANPIQRSAIVNSGGSSSGTDCSGVLDLHWTQAYSIANGLGATSNVFCQFWYRDPLDGFTTGLTNAIRFTMCP